MQTATSLRPRPVAPARSRTRPTVVAALVLALVASLQLVTGVSSASAAGTLLSQGKTATSSSTENGGTPARHAVDGNPGTRWSSAATDAEWLQVDLGASATIDRVVLRWEWAAGKAYRIETSDDASSWRPLHSTTTGQGGTETIDRTGTGRYVRMLGSARTTGYGYSLWEFEVYGSFSSPAPAPTGPDVVRVTGTQGAWQLTVGGVPYFVKGVTYGPPQGAAATYMADLKALGATTLRTWGVDDAATPTLLTTASQNGMRVMVGHWLDQNRDYVNDTAYKSAVKADVVRRVNALKGNPGVLMWNVGNEVILTMGGASPAEVEARRVAYARFVDELAVAIHQADPNHPVTSTDAYTGAWRYYQQHSPNLDLYSVNVYGGVGGVKQDWVSGGYTKPYLVTETGPPGDWEVPQDVNGVPTEPSDLAKRDAYASSWAAIAGHPGVSLGGTAFHYGVEDDYAGVWLNTYTGGQHRLGYYALQRAFTGRVGANTPPEITAMTVSSPTGVRAGSTFTVAVTASDPNGDPITYTAKQGTQHIDGSGVLGPATATQTAPGQFTVTAPQRTGVWKVYVYAHDGKGNVGIEARSVRVVP